MSFDLSEIKPLYDAQAAGVDMELMHPVTGDETGVILKVISYESPKIKALQRDLANRQMKKRNKQASFDELEMYSDGVIAAVIIGWENMVEDGVAVEYSNANALLMIKKYTFIAKQVDVFVQENSNFLPILPRKSAK